MDRTWDEFQRLQPVLNEKHGGTGSMIKLHTALERCRNLVGRWADQRRQEEPEAEPDAAVEEGADAEHAAGRAPWSGGQPRSRGEAYLMLKTAAAYLRSTEPHSPVSYLVERAIRWGGLQLDDLLNDIVASPEARAQILGILGLPSESKQ